MSKGVWHVGLWFAVLLTSSCEGDDETSPPLVAEQLPSSVVQPPQQEPVLPEGFVGQPAASMPLSDEERRALAKMSQLIAERAKLAPLEAGIAAPPTSGGVP